MKILAIAKVDPQTTPEKILLYLKAEDVQLTPVVPELVTLEQALGYVWSLPVSVLISGMENAKQVQQNAAVARKANTLDDSERLKLIATVEKFSGRDVEFYKE